MKKSNAKPSDYSVLLSALSGAEHRVRSAASSVKLARLKQQGKLPVRARIAYLLDKGYDFFEIGLFAAEGMYQTEGGCASAGVVIGIGHIHGRPVMIVANDPTVKAGAWFPMSAKKNLRAQEIALQNKIPIVYLVDSAGVYLPMQSEVFPDKEHFGRQFYNNARLSAAGVLQVAGVLGACVAGGAYLPALCDELFVVEGASIFLGASALVKAAIGEDTDNETLGGAHTHAHLSGMADHRCKDEKTCLKAIRQVFKSLPKPCCAGFARDKSAAPTRPITDVYNVFPSQRTKAYVMEDVLDCLLDQGSWQAYKAAYGKTLLCGYGRIEGWHIGIVANQRCMVKNGSGEMQMGGVIYSDSADKAARFIMNCNQRKIPLLFLHDVSGFMVGTRAEHKGIIKDGAKMVNTMANSIVPKFSIVLGNSYGAGNYAMCGRAYEPRLFLAWPSAKIGVMSGQAAAQTLWQIKTNKQKDISPKAKQKLLEETTAHYEETLSPYYAAARLWVDALIKPEDTRTIMSLAIEVANHAPIQETFKTGVLQT